MSKEFVTAPADIQKLATAIMTADTTGTNARSTYLRSIVAVVQQTLGGRPVLRVTGRPKRVEIDVAVAAFEEANTLFYTAVLEAVPTAATPEERQSKTSFARSSAATLRRAIKAGWNPLGEAVTAVSKARLAAFSKDHYQPRPVSAKAVEGRVMRYTSKIAELVDALPKDEAARVVGMVLADLGAPESAPALRNVSLRRHAPPERAAPH